MRDSTIPMYRRPGARRARESQRAKSNIHWNVLVSSATPVTRCTPLQQSTAASCRSYGSPGEPTNGPSRRHRLGHSGGLAFVCLSRCHRFEPLSAAVKRAPEELAWKLTTRPLTEPGLGGRPRMGYHTHHITSLPSSSHRPSPSWRPRSTTLGLLACKAASVASSALAPPGLLSSPMVISEPSFPGTQDVGSTRAQGTRRRYTPIHVLHAPASSSLVKLQTPPEALLGPFAGRVVLLD